jgi:hypothetical protein
VDFRFSDAVPILRRTPEVVRTLLRNLPEEWTGGNEGPNTWTPFDVVGHLIHADREDWMPRVRHILERGEADVFPAFNREGMFSASKGRTLDDLLGEFAVIRAESLTQLETLRLTETDLLRTSRHPEFGVVTLGQHLSTWVVHDFTHINQIVRVMARQYGKAVGPWQAYLSVLK